MARCGASKQNADAILARDGDRRGLLDLAVAHLHLGTEPRGRPVEGDPVERAHVQLPAEEIGVVAQHDAVRLGLNGRDIQRPPGGDAQPAALADGIADDAAVRAEALAVAVDEVAAGIGLAGEAADEGGIVAVRDEADILTVRLFRR